MTPAEALQAAIKIADDAREEWDKAPEGMKAGKLLIALSGHLKGYRSDIDQVHATAAMFDKIRDMVRALPSTGEQFGAHLLAEYIVVYFASRDAAPDISAEFLAAAWLSSLHVLASFVIFDIADGSPDLYRRIADKFGIGINTSFELASSALTEIRRELDAAGLKR